LPRDSAQIVERKRAMKLYWDKLMTVSLSEVFIMSSMSSLRLISCLLREWVICRLFELGGEMGAEWPEMKLSETARLMETIDEESEADR
jgi:hypothetical protein